MEYRTVIDKIDSDKLKNINSSVVSLSVSYHEFIRNLFNFLKSNPKKLEQYEKIKKWIKPLSNTAYCGSYDCIFGASFFDVNNIMTLRMSRCGEEDNLLNYYETARKLNKLKGEVPNFAYCYGFFQVNHPLFLKDGVIQTNEENVCGNTVINFSTSPGSTVFLCEEHVEGKTLEEFIESEENWGTINFLIQFHKIMYQILYPLHIANEKYNFIHGNLRMDNIYVKELSTPTVFQIDEENYFETDYVVYLTDFYYADFEGNLTPAYDMLNLLFQILKKNTRNHFFLQNFLTPFYTENIKSLKDVVKANREFYSKIFGDEAKDEKFIIGIAEEYSDIKYSDLLEIIKDPAISICGYYGPEYDIFVPEKYIYKYSNLTYFCEGIYDDLTTLEKMSTRAKRNIELLSNANFEKCIRKDGCEEKLLKSLVNVNDFSKKFLTEIKIATCNQHYEEDEWILNTMSSVQEDLAEKLLEIKYKLSNSLNQKVRDIAENHLN